MVFWRCGRFALSDHVRNGVLVTKTFFNFSAGLVVDLLKFSRDTALLLEQALDVTDLAFGLQMVSD